MYSKSVVAGPTSLDMLLQHLFRALDMSRLYFLSNPYRAHFDDASNLLGEVWRQRRCPKLETPRCLKLLLGLRGLFERALLLTPMPEARVDA
jgi:hypothetical protein